MPYSPFLRCSVSTHSLARRLTYLPLYNKWGRLCFNSQPRKEADLTDILDRQFQHISTHSLARRLTHLWPLLLFLHRVSTHSLARRLTVYIGFLMCATKCFNSQPRKEADTEILHLRKHRNVSTHSLARRLTLLQLMSVQDCGCFNSQPRKEADVYHWLFSDGSGAFQLTASQGG